MERKRDAWEEDQCMRWLSQKLGIGIASVASTILELADLADKQSRKRKIPEGRDPYWWARNWEMIALMLRKLVAFQKGQSDG